MINEVRIIGNVGQDPDIRNIRNGILANVSVATTEKWKDRDNNWQENTQWHSVSCFGRVADMVEKYVEKGQQVYVEGSIEYNDGEKDGIRVRYTNIKARKIKILGRKQESNNNQRDDHPGYGGTGEDIPF